MHTVLAIWQHLSSTQMLLSKAKTLSIQNSKVNWMNKSVIGTVACGKIQYAWTCVGFRELSTAIFSWQEFQWWLRIERHRRKTLASGCEKQQWRHIHWLTAIYKYTSMTNKFSVMNVYTRSANVDGIRAQYCYFPQAVQIDPSFAVRP